MNKINEVVLYSEIFIGSAVAIIALAVIAWLVLLASHAIFRKYYEMGQQAQWETDSRRLMDCANWFGEDTATVNLIRNLARDGSDTSSVRDKWRNDRATIKPE